MKRSLAMMTCALCGVMVFGSFSPVMAAGAKAAATTVKEDSAEETKEEKTETSEDAALEDGTYVAEFDSDSGMFHANEANDGKGILTVKDGEMTFHVSLASKHIVNLFVGTAEDAQKEGAELLEPTTDTVTYSDGMSEEVYGFDIPVENIDEEFDLALIGTKGKWYDHKVKISNPEKDDDTVNTLEEELEEKTEK